MKLMSDICKQVHDIYCKAPRICCTDFEDNVGVLDISRLPKMRPRNKHLNAKLHHFQQFVKDGTIKLRVVPSDEQLENQLTNPLPEA